MSSNYFTSPYLCNREYVTRSFYQPVQTEFYTTLTFINIPLKEINKKHSIEKINKNGIHNVFLRIYGDYVYDNLGIRAWGSYRALVVIAAGYLLPPTSIS